MTPLLVFPNFFTKIQWPYITENLDTKRRRRDYLICPHKFSGHSSTLNQYKEFPTPKRRTEWKTKSKHFNKSTKPHSQTTNKKSCGTLRDNKCNQTINNFFLVTAAKWVSCGVLFIVLAPLLQPISKHEIIRKIWMIRNVCIFIAKPILGLQPR